MATINVGTGSGNLTIDGVKLGANNNNSTISIKGGQYSGMTIQNCSSVTITNNGLVEITGNQNALNLSSLNNVLITGNGTAGILQGFYLHDNNYRPVQFKGLNNGVTLQFFLFQNLGDYVISNDFGKIVYDSSNPNTYWNGLHILNCEFNNTGQINFQGFIGNDQITGMIKNFEMAYCYLHDMSPGDLVFAMVMDNYNIHHNIVNNVNSSNNDDNGLWHIQGNGIFAYNKITNHQGHAIRAWLVSFGTTLTTTLIYNNIVYNSRKYSAFEVQSFQSILISGETTFGDALCYYNTVGNMNMSKDSFPGVVIDVYGLFGGTCNVFDNLGFNFPVPNPSSNIVSQQYTTVPTVNNNLYCATAALAGVATDTFQLGSWSPAIAKGISNLTNDDYYGNKRNNPPSLGAVEYGGVTTIPTPPVATQPSIPVTTQPSAPGTTPPKTVISTITLYSDGTYKIL